MSQHPWDAVDRGPGGQYVKWDTVGQAVTGTIARIGTGTDLNGNQVPEIDIDTDDGDTVTISASQVNLRRQLLDLVPLPSVGDRIAIKFARTEKAGRGDMKVFEVASKPGEPAAAASAGATSAADLL